MSVSMALFGHSISWFWLFARAILSVNVTFLKSKPLTGLLPSYSIGATGLLPSYSIAATGLLSSY